jgi:hypothetical protein
MNFTYLLVSLDRGTNMERIIISFLPPFKSEAKIQVSRETLQVSFTLARTKVMF